MNGAGGRGTSKSRRRVAGGSGSSPDEVLERIGPRGDGELVSEAKFPASGSLQGISGILAQMGPSGIRAQIGPKLRSGTFNKGSIGLVAMSVLGTPCRPGESLVAFSRDPVLAVWQAMKPLAEIGARTDASDIAKIVTEAEIILFGLVRALSRRL